jgi:hypothetical protein
MVDMTILCGVVGIKDVSVDETAPKVNPSERLKSANVLALSRDVPYKPGGFPRMRVPGTE